MQLEIPDKTFARIVKEVVEDFRDNFEFTDIDVGLAVKDQEGLNETVLKILAKSVSTENLFDAMTIADEKRLKRCFKVLKAKKEKC